MDFKFIGEVDLMKMKNAFKTQEGKIEVIKSYDSFVKRWASPYEELEIETCCGITHVIASGNIIDPPVILLHGTGMNSVMWLSQARDYSKYYRVYAVDVPGDPGKSSETQYPLEGLYYADWLKDVLDGLNINKSTLIGISLGAWLAVKFAVNYKDRVDKLVLISPSGIGSQRKSFIFWTLLYSMFGDKGTERLFLKINGDKPMPEEMMNYQKLIKKCFKYRKETIPIFTDNELTGLNMPVALFAGEKDIMLNSDETARRLIKLLPQTYINLLKDEGHSITDISNKVIEFLKSL